MIPARKRWGQHFLASGETALRIVEAARILPSDTVVEVGPGEGALTRPLARRVRRLLAIEIDPRRAAALEEEFAGDPRVRIARGDALDRSFGAWLREAGWEGPAVLVANLPYNAATPILQAAIVEPEAIARSLVTVQREVAQRLCARPGDDGYGYLSVRVAAFAQARILFDLPRGAFRPRPKVLSSVVALTPRIPQLDPARRERALALASLGFRSRRKTLANALAAEGARAGWEGALDAMGKSRKARAEELSLDEYLNLAEIIEAKSA
jgi:16S rRNA (adenine1518-N6/adenine1519-N6)-dimethyltransferase